MALVMGFKAFFSTSLHNGKQDVCSPKVTIYNFQVFPETILCIFQSPIRFLFSAASDDLLYHLISESFLLSPENLFMAAVIMVTQLPDHSLLIYPVSADPNKYHDIS